MGDLEGGKFLLIRFVSLFLRGGTLISKFLLIFLLARFLEPADLGLYGLLAATISYSLYIVGFDFYIFTTREIVKYEQNSRGRLLKSQVYLSLILYGLFFPLSLLLFIFDLLPWWLLPWFLGLLVLEHLGQELNRLLVAMSRQIVASWVLFFRAGAWCLAVVMAMYVDVEKRNLQTIVSLWVLGSAIAFGIGAMVIARERFGGWERSCDWGWVKRGLRIALPMLIATLALRALYTLDRYWFEALAGLDMLGAYVLFIGMCNALIAFMDAGVFTFMYPTLIAAHTRSDSEVFRKKFRQMAVQTVVLAALFTTVAWIVVDPLLVWLDRPLYLEHQDLFWWLLMATVLFVIGMIPHYGLYARGQDKPLIKGHIAGLLVFGVATAVFAPIVSELAVPFGLIAAFSFILCWKTVHFYRLTPPGWR